MNDALTRSAARFAGRVAIVTGSSTGIGRTIALELARGGAAVLCADVRKSALPESADAHPGADTDDAINSMGGCAAWCLTDVGVVEQVEQTVADAIGRWGRLDIWVNNAGISAGGALLDITPEQFRRMQEVNLQGSWLGARAAARVMMSQDRIGRSRGRIVNVGSLAAEIGVAGISSYVAAKGGVHALTRALAVELAPYYVNVNAVAPGHFVHSAMGARTRTDVQRHAAVKALVPWPEMSERDDVAHAVAFLASDDAAWITGHVLPVDGGQRLI